MLAIDWIERVKNELKLDSDYSAAKTLGISRQAISNMRAGIRTTLGDKSAYAVADALGISARDVLVDQAIEAVDQRMAGFVTPLLLPVLAVASSLVYILC